MNYEQEIKQLIVHSTAAIEFFLVSVQKAKILNWKETEQLINKGINSWKRLQKIKEELMLSDEGHEEIDLIFKLVIALRYVKYTDEFITFCVQAINQIHERNRVDSYID